jgi:hypothetical protein
MSVQDRHKSDAKLAAIVIVVAMVGWMGATFLGGRFGVAQEYAFLVDLMALAAFVWAIIVCVRIWRARQLDRND